LSWPAFRYHRRLEVPPFVQPGTYLRAVLVDSQLAPLVLDGLTHGQVKVLDRVTQLGREVLADHGVGGRDLQLLDHVLDVGDKGCVGLSSLLEEVDHLARGPTERGEPFEDPVDLGLPVVKGAEDLGQVGVRVLHVRGRGGLFGELPSLLGASLQDLGLADVDPRRIQAVE
jgi:hypothetical protein